MNPSVKLPVLFSKIKMLIHTLNFVTLSKPKVDDLENKFENN